MTESVWLVSWGRGNGHITRLVNIATAFAEQDWDVDLLTHANATHQTLVDQACIRSVQHYPAWADDADPWTDWSSPEFLSRSVELDRRYLRELQPSRVVHDNRLSLTIACLMEGVPFVTLCQDNQIPGFTYDGTVAPIWTAPVDAINAMLQTCGLLAIETDARELFTRGRIAIPSTPELDPVPRSANLDLVYTGPLQRLRNRASDPVDVLLYRTVGHDEGSFISAFSDWPGRILVATGDEASSQALEEALRATAAEVAPMWDLDEVGPNLAAVVHHGGHGITTAMITAGIPTVVLPGHNPERQSNAERAAMHSASIVLPPPIAQPATWGPAVDVTGDIPAWSVVRDAVDSVRHTPRRRPGFDTAPTDLVKALT
ncbi:hypothetical protein NY546_08715 [Curtobacterium flaccumfaciens pv. flaccumfaciens]|uniref:glycosyltransferase n=1 Tax=Curtobacterium flaccumfaciens TaxID=2035 RepID=UPI00265AB501|nr:nucleotide disphospho-sugar-binding domain-containing protein [Curtobacterium flaccumfaciens]MCS5509372.1 hypothetical protein [Curtobacterium flaccumfaciens pv. flaccumfaciens]MCX2785770.1 hypothetical protein [Curtobacterium flaccumfaciens pv. flaccumfaciens]